MMVVEVHGWFGVRIIGLVRGLTWCEWEIFYVGCQGKIT